MGGDAQPDRPVPTPSWHQEDRPSVLPVGIYACCVTAKLRRGYGGMGRRASGFVARVADGDNTAHQLRKYLFVFHDIDMKRVGGIVCTHSASAPAPPPLNFTLAPRNADRIVAPE